MEGRANRTGQSEATRTALLAAARRAVRRARLRGGGHRGDRAAREGHARRPLPPLPRQARPLPGRPRGGGGGAGRARSASRSPPTSPPTPSRRSAPGCARSSTRAPTPPWHASRWWTRPRCSAGRSGARSTSGTGSGWSPRASRGRWTPARSPKQPVKALAHLMLGAMGEAGMLIANAEDPQATRRGGGAGAAGAARRASRHRGCRPRAAGRSCRACRRPRSARRPARPRRAERSPPPAPSAPRSRTGEGPPAPPAAWRWPSPRADAP